MWLLKSLSGLSFHDPKRYYWMRSSFIPVNSYLLDVTALLTWLWKQTTFIILKYTSYNRFLVWGLFITLDEEKYEKFHHLYCHYCESSVLPQIWSEHSEKLPKERTIENLMVNWDSLGLTWIQNDILGCIIPNEAAIFRNKLISIWVAG